MEKLLVLAHRCRRRYVAGEPTCADMGVAGAHVSGTRAPYNVRASEAWRSYSGMFYSGGLSSEVAGDIVRHNQNFSKLSRLGVWGGAGSGGAVWSNMLMSFTEQGHGYGLLQHDQIELFVLQVSQGLG